MRTENDISLAHARDAELVEQRDQLRIGAVVEDEEAGVDRTRDAVERHVDGVRVPAEARRSASNTVTAWPCRVQQPRAEPRPAMPGADDRDAHDGFPGAGVRRTRGRDRR